MEKLLYRQIEFSGDFVGYDKRIWFGDYVVFFSLFFTNFVSTDFEYPMILLLLSILCRL